MTTEEGRLLELLFSADFPGKKELRAQASNATVRTVDEYGSFEFLVAKGTPVNVRESVPVSARLPDASGVDAFGPSVNLLLHVRSGILHLLEIYKDDGTPIMLPLNFSAAFVRTA